MKKMLIIQTAFIGDVVLATNLIEKLHLFFPDASIDFLVRKGNEGLLAGHPILHEVLIWDKKKNKQRNLLRLLSTIRRTKYDVVINVQRFAATGILTAFSGARQTIGFAKNPLSFLFTKRVAHEVGEDNTKHETVRNLALIEDLTDNSYLRPRLYPSPEDKEKVARYTNQDFITVSPASVWFTKQFPAAQWVAFINRVPEQHAVFLLGGPGDQELCESISLAVNHPKVDNLAGQLTFLQSAALMSRAHMNFVNDSAPMHFASAMNAPVTAVFCSTVPAFGFGPLSDKHHIVEIEEPLYCRPCGLHGYKACPEKHFLCAKNIREEQLLNAL